jgi:hypothetical protein
MLPRHRRAAAIMVLLVSVVGCASQPPGAPSHANTNIGPVIVSGRVLDFSTNAGVAGATVSFGTTDGGPFAAVGTTTSNATGSYTLSMATVAQMPGPRPWDVEVDSVWIGRALLMVAGYRGDLLVHPGTCVTRYGIVADSQTLRPIASATVKLLASSAVTTIDGWYRIDLGCPANSWVGYNTTFLYVTHPEHMDGSETVGRGVHSTERIDVWLQPRSSRR